MNEVFVTLQRGAARVAVFLLVSLPTAKAGATMQPASTDTDIISLEIEQLMDIRVTSAAKKEQRLSDASAAIFVITQEDIRRSGVTSIPEALRMAPGMQVARFNTNRWAVSARGFNSPYDDKLLVLMDGRTVSSPLFSGVFWDVQDTVLEDIDRIEVIRGPGATLWGANAMNGVINIITKKTEDTRGALVAAGVGSEERAFGSVRYGGNIGTATSYRLYTKYFERDDAVDQTGRRAADSWRAKRSGFRLEHAATAESTLTLQGDIYQSNAGQSVEVSLPSAPIDSHRNELARSRGGNLLGRWSWEGANRGSSLQFYYDRTVRDEAGLSERIDSYDLDFQHRCNAFAFNEITLGLGFRHTHDSFVNSLNLTLLPEERRKNLYSAFLQDQITLLPEHLRLIIGTKLEHNEYSGFEVQPTVRLIWTPDQRSSFWGAVSRAVRTPNRFTSDTSSYHPEALLAYEAGYRVQAARRLSLDISTFYNDYRNLFTQEAGEPALTLTESSLSSNTSHGETYGIELAADWHIIEWWRMHAAYTYLQMRLSADSDAGIASSMNPGGNNHRHQLSVRSTFDLRHDLELDLWLRYADSLPQLAIASYAGLDVRLAWQATRTLEIALIGQNLLDNHHPEFSHVDTSIHPTELQRGVYGKLTWQF